MGTRIAVLSDLHGNAEATGAVLAAIDAAAPDAVACLGDLVGYGANPNETAAMVRERAIPTVMGNYDDGVGFDPSSQKADRADAGFGLRNMRALAVSLAGKFEIVSSKGSGTRIHVWLPLSHARNMTDQNSKMG